MAPWLEEKGREPHALDLIPGNGEAALDDLARQVAAYIESNFTADRSIDLVGFSMGGLVARFYLQRLGGASRTRRLITIGSPHNGTWTAYVRSSPGVRQMRPGSAFLQDLNGDIAALDPVRVTSIWTPFDLMILPAASSRFNGARNIRINVGAHPLMVRDRRVLELVHQLLAEDEDTGKKDKPEGQINSARPVTAA